MHSVKWCKDWVYSLHLNKCCLTPHYHAHQDSCQSQYSLESLILLCITDQCPWSLLWTLGWLVHVWLFTYPVTTKDTISWSTYLDHIPSMWCWLILTLCFLKCFLQNSYMLPCFLLPSVRYYLAQLKEKIRFWSVCERRHFDWTPATERNGKSWLVLYLFFIISHYSYVVVNMLLSLLLC